MLTVKEVKGVLREYDIRPNKRLGQSFLIDKNIRDKIIDASGIKKEDIVLEIGSGLGALTEGLCKRAKKVKAVEKDRRLYDYLLENCKRSNLELICSDILKYDFSPFSKLKIVGNLPYSISSPILIHLLNNRVFIDTIFITVQKEVAERIIAKEGSKIYGAISCFVRFYTVPKVLFTIKKNAFYPVPKVDSCFLRLDIDRQSCCLTDEEKLFKIIRASFGKRRKMILNSLYSSGLFKSKEELLKELAAAGILPNTRPEAISLEKFIMLTDIIGGKK